MGSTLPLNPTGTAESNSTKYDMTAGEYVRFDMLLAVGDIYVELEIRDAIAGGGSSACEMTVLALDGVFLSAPRVQSYIAFAPASRVTVAVMCSSAGTYYMQSNPTQRVGDYEALYAQNLVTLVVGSTAPLAPRSPPPRRRGAAATSQEDMQSTTASATWELGVEQTGVTSPASYWIGIGKNCTLECGGRNCGSEQPDPNAFGECKYEPFGGTSLAYRHTGVVCGVVDLVINGRGRTAHPIHIHVNHFQLISVYDSSGKDHPDLKDGG
eukprot:CAMPEP_0175828336 /NCGR_PEP_ID=MMETSP0107_2-20121207/12752_1 /TAXON_ID=195067 ORGANISM="Goniomonas pacifica, Strain CCMP1869" /NCGR_SAMPLE_ID=MMETSP0107_2 /ASSEMBLY_ACC=CAM_ASM_000203 /LENGTH=267 /DNA_ID=CAMNT_0017141051 /DNA_START=101 /DNA_END=901 /DNA_ORIENTATION=+